MGQQRPLIGGSKKRVSRNDSNDWPLAAPITSAATSKPGFEYSNLHGFVYWDRGRREAAAFVSNSTLPPWATIELQRELVAALAGTAPRKETGPPFLKFDRETRSNLAGSYVGEPLGTVTLSAEGKRLRMRIADGLDYDVFAVGSEVFYLPGLDHCVAFSDRGGTFTMHVNSMFVQARLALTSNGQSMSTPTGQ